MAVQGVSGENPNGFVRVPGPDLAQELQDTRLILGFEGFATQDGEAPDMIWRQIGENLVDGFLGKGAPYWKSQTSRLKQSLQCRVQPDTKMLTRTPGPLAMSQFLMVA